MRHETTICGTNLLTTTRAGKAGRLGTGHPTAFTTNDELSGMIICLLCVCFQRTMAVSMAYARGGSVIETGATAVSNSERGTLIAFMVIVAACMITAVLFPVLCVMLQ